MAHDDTDVLNERLTGDSLSDFRRLATPITDADVKLDPAHPTHGSDAEQQLAEDIDTATFTFVNTLAADISSGEFKLPSWPEMVVQIKRALENDECSVERVVRLIGSEPVLAARLLKVMNSDFHHGGHPPIKDLRTAVDRLGADTVQSVAISLATEQCCHGLDLRPIKPYLAELWRHSFQVATIAYILAKKYTEIRPHEASQLEHVQRNTATPMEVTANTVATEIAITRGSVVLVCNLLSNLFEKTRGYPTFF